MEVLIDLLPKSPASKLSPYNLNSLLDAASTVVEMNVSGSSTDKFSPSL